MKTPDTTKPSRPDASDVLADLALAINQELGVSDVQQLVVDRAVATLQAESGSVMLPADEPGNMRMVATTRPGDVREAPESPVAQWVVEHDAPMLLLGRTGPLAHLLHREDIRDAVCVPLRYAGGAIGALSVSNSQGRGPFGKADVALLTSIGHLAAVALRNTMLFDEAREHRERLRAVLRQLWSAQEDERRRVAADLHDGPAQSLFNAVFRAQTARQAVNSNPDAAGKALLETEAAVRDALAQLRAVMNGLRPMSLDDLGLIPALKNECTAIASRGHVQVDVEVLGEPARLDSRTETGLYRITREALINVERHSGSNTARLTVECRQAALEISVEDWGVGFDAEALRSARQSGHIGLTAMRERADDLGITLTLSSVPGHGTRMTLQCPIRNAG